MNGTEAWPEGMRRELDSANALELASLDKGER
jgi:hypothetical protein